MALIAFVSLDYGSITETRLKLDLAKEFGGSTEHVFNYTCCRMRYVKDGKVNETLVGIYEELPVTGSHEFIEFLQNHRLSIKKEDILGIMHPSVWACKDLIKINHDIAVIKELAQRFSMPILGG